MTHTNTGEIPERQLRQTAVSGSRFVPMLFSTPMVQAILNGTKTETRRIIDVDNSLDFMGYVIGGTKRNGQVGFGKDVEIIKTIKPLVNIDDIIWVRETFAVVNDKTIYKASVCSSDFDKPKNGWKPSLFMPKSAARIFLKVVFVSVERLHDIDEQSAINEGVEFSAEFGYKLYSKNDFFSKNLSASDSYMSLWQKINGKDSWNLNPFVWVYKFQRIDEPYGFR